MTNELKDRKMYEITIVKTYVAEVEADSADAAYEKFHNQDQYESLTCVDEVTESIYKVTDTN